MKTSKFEDNGLSFSDLDQNGKIVFPPTLETLLAIVRYCYFHGR